LLGGLSRACRACLGYKHRRYREWETSPTASALVKVGGKRQVQMPPRWACGTQATDLLPLTPP